jgi:hypothetical protein
MTFTITQGDNSPSLVTTLSDEDGSRIDLSNVSGMRFIMQDRYERVVIDESLGNNLSIVDTELGIVEFIFSSSVTESVGEYEAELEATYSNGAVETFPTTGKIDIEVIEHIA